MIDINKLISEAMKSRNSIALNAYKNLKAEIQLFKTAKNAKEYDDVAEAQVIGKYCKKLETAISEFENGGREDLAGDYKSELAVLQPLLPELPSTDDIKSAIKEWMDINEVTSVPQKSFGIVVKYVKMKLPLADGKGVSEAVREFVI